MICKAWQGDGLFYLQLNIISAYWFPLYLNFYIILPDSSITKNEMEKFSDN